MSVGNLYELLTNPIYIGRIRHKKESFPGLHSAILDQDLWDETQQRLDRNRQGTKERRLIKNSAWLTGKIFDENGERLVPVYTLKASRRYNYYTSHFLIGRDPADDRKGWRLPAHDFDQMVEREVTTLLTDKTALAALWHECDLPLSLLQSAIDSGKRIVPAAVADVIDRIELSPSGLRLDISIPQDGCEAISLVRHKQISIRRRGQEMRIVLDNEIRKVDPVLLSAVARGRKWFEELSNGTSANMIGIAEKNGISDGRVNQLVRLAFLSPRIVQAIIEGRQPSELTTKTFSKLTDFPIGWAKQEALLGF